MLQRSKVAISAVLLLCCVALAFANHAAYEAASVDQLLKQENPVLYDAELPDMSPGKPDTEYMKKIPKQTADALASGNDGFVIVDVDGDTLPDLTDRVVRPPPLSDADDDNDGVPTSLEGFQTDFEAFEASKPWEGVSSSDAEDGSTAVEQTTTQSDLWELPTDEARFMSFFDVWPEVTRQDLALASSLSGLGIGLSPVFTKPWLNFGTIKPGPDGCVSRRVCVRVAQAPIDIYFLADTTGSMYSSIAAIQASAFSIYSSLTTQLTNLRIGVGAYRDMWADGPVWGWQNIAPVAALTASQFNTAVGQWAAGGGGDWPESYLHALNQIATNPGINWRPGSTRIVVWFGDAPSQEPDWTGLTTSAVVANLNAAGVRVLGLDVSGLAAPWNLDFSGQATAVTSGTGGALYMGLWSGPALVSTIVSAVLSVPVTVTPVVNCPLNSPLVITVDPPSAVATPQKPACFTIKVCVCSDLECLDGPYKCTIKFLNTATGMQIGPLYTIFANMLGTDTTPPVFSPAFSPNPLHVTTECPEMFKPPRVEAIDNCCGPTINVTGLSVLTSSTCPAKTDTIWTYTATDCSGNTAVQTVIVHNDDTTPPLVNQQCLKKTFCGWLTETPGPSGTIFCLDRSFWKGCFKDACFGDRLTYNVVCDKCEDNGPWTFTPPKSDGTPGTQEIKTQCQGYDNVLSNTDKVCITVYNMGKYPHCCSMNTTVADPCGNSITVPMPRFCVFPRHYPPNPDLCTTIVRDVGLGTADPKHKRALLAAGAEGQQQDENVVLPAHMGAEGISRLAAAATAGNNM